MEELFVRPRALTRMREGPLGMCIDTFIGSLAAKGYSRDSQKRDESLKLQSDHLIPSKYHAH